MSHRVVLSTRLPRTLKRIGWIALWLLGGGTLLAAVFIFSFFTAMRVAMRSTQVSVPDLTGLTLASAKERTAPLDLVVAVVDQRNDPRVPSGRVLETHLLPTEERPTNCTFGGPGLTTLFVTVAGCLYSAETDRRGVAS